MWRHRSSQLWYSWGQNCLWRSDGYLVRTRRLSRCQSLCGLKQRLLPVILYAAVYKNRLLNMIQVGKVSCHIGILIFSLMRLIFRRGYNETRRPESSSGRPEIWSCRILYLNRVVHRCHLLRSYNPEGISHLLNCMELGCASVEQGNNGLWRSRWIGNRAACAFKSPNLTVGPIHEYPKY